MIQEFYLLMCSLRGLQVETKRKDHYVLVKI